MRISLHTVRKVLRSESRMISSDDLHGANDFSQLSIERLSNHAIILRSNSGTALALYIVMAGRKKGQGSKWIRPEKRAKIYASDNHTCQYCGGSIYDTADMLLTLDHIVPCELGGGNEATNLVTACLSCNSSKQDLPLGAFLQVLADRGIDPRQVRKNVRNATRRHVRIERRKKTA